MKRFVEAVDHGQSTLFPASLDDYVPEDNPVRAVDVFVDVSISTSSGSWVSSRSTPADPAIIPALCSSSTSTAISIACRRADAWRCAGHAQQLGSESLLPNLMEVKG